MRIYYLIITLLITLTTNVRAETWRHKDFCPYIAPELGWSHQKGKVYGHHDPMNANSAIGERSFYTDNAPRVGMSLGVLKNQDKLYFDVAAGYFYDFTRARTDIDVGVLIMSNYFRRKDNYFLKSSFGYNIGSWTPFVSLGVLFSRFKHYISETATNLNQQDQYKNIYGGDVRLGMHLHPSDKYSLSVYYAYNLYGKFKTKKFILDEGPDYYRATERPRYHNVVFSLRRKLY